MVRIIIVDRDPENWQKILGCELIGSTKVPRATDWVQFSQSVVDSIAKNANLEMTDLIIIGNNVGHGLNYVPPVPLSMRKRVIIVSHEPLTPGVMNRYQELSIRHFMLREQLSPETIQEFMKKRKQ